MARNKRWSPMSAQSRKAINRAHKATGNFTRFGGKPKASADWQAPIEENESVKNVVSDTQQSDLETYLAETE